MKKTLLIIATLFLSFHTTRAQFLDPEPYIVDATEDMNYLAGGYLSPLGKALISFMNNGWYHSADPMTPGSFYISITPTLIRIPDEQDQFLIENSKLQELELANGFETALSPTAFGASDGGPELRSKNSGYTFQAPGGLESDYLPGAGVNLAVGLPLGSAIHARVLPRIKFSIGDEQEMELASWGFGGMHSLSQYFVGEESTFDLSVFAAYSHFNVFLPLNSGDDHQVELNTNGFNARGIVSNTYFGWLTPYVGVGINSGTSQIDVKGTFEYNTLLGSESVTDPVSVSTETSGQFTANLGIHTLIFKVISFDINYTFSDYNALTAGIGAQIKL